MPKRWCAFFCLLVLLQAALVDNQALSPLDPHSHSRPDLVKVTHVSLDLSVDFQRNVFVGSATLTLQKILNMDEIVLDSKDLIITKIEVVGTFQQLQYTITESSTAFGSKLTVKIPKSVSSSIRIYYETSPDASGLQWLVPEQTAGKRYPFLFSNFQFIHARSFLPCQDTPGLKFTYEARITVPSELTVIMSGVNYKVQDLSYGERTFYFIQNNPISAYLIAITVGAIQQKQIGPRTRVWAEIETLEAAAYEFAYTEDYIRAAEDICGAYVWTVFDLLILPPSYPYGGMENPCITFVTPTLLAGDRSLINVIAHELAHSWTGNLVTNRNFEHFWLNEGFTTFVERRIIGRMTSKADEDFLAIGGLAILEENIASFGDNNPLTELVVDLTGIDPDDAYSRVPYEKGQIFLRYLEDLVGGPAIFEVFMKKYFIQFKYKSLDSYDFQQFFISYFRNLSIIQTIDWNLWFKGTGMPPVIPKFDDTKIVICIQIEEKLVMWRDREPIPITKVDVITLTTQQKIYLLQRLIDREPFSIRKLIAIEEVFGFYETKNAEIKYRWLRLGLRSHWEEKLTIALEWVNQVGRMKYVRPLYREMYAWCYARPLAIENFQKNRKHMMHVLEQGLIHDLHLYSV